MTTKEITEYYESTKDRKIRSELIYAVEEVVNPRVVIDCGCGAGADINYLLSNEFQIYGFDSESLAIEVCKERFKGNTNVVLSKDTFSSFNYPQATLVLADASLFFCPKNDFGYVWEKMYECLYPKGIFCGSFLGPEDKMASTSYDKDAYWADILVVNEVKVRELFEKGYEILRFKEHKSSGNDPDGAEHNWHIFSVVARKI
jgi:SAM-dependent methyltransferase